MTPAIKRRLKELAVGSDPRPRNSMGQFASPTEEPLSPKVVRAAYAGALNRPGARAAVGGGFGAGVFSGGPGMLAARGSGAAGGAAGGADVLLASPILRRLFLKYKR